MVGAYAYVAAFKQVTLPIQAKDPELVNTTYPAWACEFVSRMEQYFANPSDEEYSRLVSWDPRCRLSLSHPFEKMLGLFGSGDLLLSAAKAELIGRALTADRAS